MHPPILLVFCTCPDEETAERIADTLVEERLAACVNRIPGIRSTYRWQGAIQRDPEILLLIKTTEARYPALESRLRALHPYELPEILRVPIREGLSDYFQWVHRCTSDPASPSGS